jgi:hypothetical protein
VTPACGEERRWSVQPLQRMDSGSRRMFALSGSPHDPLAAQPVRAATYETLIADTDCGRLITWVGGGERGLLRNERFWTAPRRHETWGRPSQASPGLSRVSSHPGDGTTRVLGCAQGWTILWRAVSALGTRLALKSVRFGGGRPANRVWLGEGGTREGGAIGRLTALRPTSGLSGCSR